MKLMSTDLCAVPTVLFQQSLRRDLLIFYCKDHFLIGDENNSGIETLEFL
jgi:hypothetical protein